jgi:hypothetical protein
MAEPRPARVGHPVPALIVRPAETSVRVLFLDVRDGRLRLRFQTTLGPGQKSLEVTFVCEKSQRPIVRAQASLSVDNEYRFSLSERSMA